MKKDIKDFTAALIGNPERIPEPVRVQEEQPRPEPAEQIQKEETKSAHMHILIRPSIKAALKQRAAADGISMNDLINKALQEYTERTERE